MFNFFTPPNPKVPYELTHNDRRLLRALRIAQDEPPRRDPNTLPYQSNPRRTPEDDDGA